MACYENQNKDILDWFIFPFFLIIASIILLKYYRLPENDKVCFYFKYKSKVSEISWCKPPVLKREYIEA